MSQRYASLIEAYSEARRRVTYDPTSQRRVLLDGWFRVAGKAANQGCRLFENLLSGRGDSIQRLRASQLTTAEDFNLLEVLHLVDDEQRHSKVLAWLLDQRATHAQGSLGLKLLLEELKFDPRLQISYANAPYRVRLEVPGEESRIDIEVAARGEFLIHIENKIWATEGDHQLKRESEDLRRRAREIGVPTENTHAFFLTPTGWLPPEPFDFRPLSWRRIAKVFDAFAATAQAPSVQWLARHYAEALRRCVAPVQQSPEDL